MNPREILRHHFPAASFLCGVSDELQLFTLPFEFGAEITTGKTRPWCLSDEEMNATLGINLPNDEFATSLRTVRG
jgi:hypothetical protein